jgi:hypothetical protein
MLRKFCWSTYGMKCDPSPYSGLYKQIAVTYKYIFLLPVAFR